MRLPEWWEKVEAGWYIELTDSPRPACVEWMDRRHSFATPRRAGWHAWRRGDPTPKPFGVYRTARAAFAALGIEVRLWSP